jgi:hypothetical protein
LVDLSFFIKDCVSAVTKKFDQTLVVLANDTLVVESFQTTLSIIPLGFETNIYSGFAYPGDYTKSDSSIFHHVLQNWEKYDQLVRHCPVVGEIPDLKAIESYATLLNRKSDDGAGVFRMPGNDLNEQFVLYVFTGFPNLNKTDDVGIVVRRIDYGTLLMEYHINKKKLGKNITMYFRTCDMNRRLLDEQFIIRQ